MSVAPLGVRISIPSHVVRRRWNAACSLALALALSACGGDDGASTAAPSQPTPPAAALPAATAPPSRIALTITSTAPASYQWDELAVGKTAHIDLAEAFTAVPGKYKGLKFLRTANADRFLSAASAIAFQTNKDVTVLVAYDAQAAAARPLWLADWADTGDTLTTSAATYRLYRKGFAVGTIALGGNELGFSTYTVVVDDGTAIGNSGPTIAGNAPTDIGATREYVFVPSAGDSDGDTLRFTATNLPPWATLNTTTGAVTGTPAANQLGTYADIVITVSDGATNSSLQPFSIVVNPVDANSSPVILGQPQTVIAKDTLYTFVPTANDADGDALVFSVANLPRWASFYSDIGRIRGMPGTGDVGTYSNIVVSVSDGEKKTSLPAFTVQVKSEAVPNAAPTIGGVTRLSIAAGQTYDFTPSAADADGYDLSFSISNRPAWAAFNSSTGRLSGTPQDAHAGVYADIVIAVSDGSATTALPAFAVTVTGTTQGSESPPSANLPLPPSPPANPPAPTNPPSATSSPPQISGTPPTTAPEGQPYSFSPSASDPDGDELTFSIANRPNWATFNNGTGRLSGTPSAGAVGTHSGIVISVNDGEATRSLPTFAITVTAAPPAPPPSAPQPNSPPSISGTPASTVRQNQSFSFTPSASDADGNPLTFTISNRPSWTSFSNTTGRLSGTPSASSAGTYSGIVISVSDGEATRSLPAFTLTVTPTATGSATLSWLPPTQNTDGSPLSDLAGYKIYWGQSQRDYSNSVTLNNPGLASYIVEQLTSGRWYFATTSFNSQGVESAFSNEGSKTIP